MKKNSHLSLFLKLSSVVLILFGCFATICNADQDKIPLKKFVELYTTGNVDIQLKTTKGSQQYLSIEEGDIDYEVFGNSLDITSKQDGQVKLTLHTPPTIQEVNVCEGNLRIYGGKFAKHCCFIPHENSKLALNGIAGGYIDLSCYCSHSQVTVENLKARRFCSECREGSQVTVKNVDASELFTLVCRDDSKAIVDNVNTTSFTSKCEKKGQVTVKNVDASEEFCLECKDGEATINSVNTKSFDSQAKNSHVTVNKIDASESLTLKANCLGKVTVNEAKTKTLRLQAKWRNIYISGAAEKIFNYNKVDVSNIALKPYITPIDASFTKLLKSNKAKTYGDTLIVTKK